MSFVLDTGAEYAYRNSNLPTGAFTLAAWVYFNSTTEGSIFAFTSGAGIVAVRINGSANLRAYAQDPANASGTLSSGTWYHIFLRQDGGSAEAGYMELGGSSYTKTGAITGYSLATAVEARAGVDNVAYNSAQANYAGLGLWGESVSDANLLTASASLDPTYTTNLVSWVKAASGSLSDSSGNGYDWTASGTIGGGSDPTLGSTAKPYYYYAQQ